MTKIFKTISVNGGLLILAVCIGLLIGAGFGRSCAPGPTVSRIIEKDSTVYNIIDSTWIVWDTVTKKIVNPTPTSMVLSSTTKNADTFRNGCACDSVRNYTGRISLQSGFVNYNITATGKIDEMIFSPQIGVQNRFRNVDRLRYYTKTETIDNTPHWWLFAGAEVNPQSLSSMSFFADVHSRKWLFGYRYELNDLRPHNLRLGIKIFQL